MVAQLTKNERQLGLIISVLVALLGLAMAAAGSRICWDPWADRRCLRRRIRFPGDLRLPPTGAHERALASYYDDPIKVGLVLAMLWAVFTASSWGSGCLALSLPGPHL